MNYKNELQIHSHLSCASVACTHRPIPTNRSLRSRKRVATAPPRKSLVSLAGLAQARFAVSLRVPAATYRPRPPTRSRARTAGYRSRPPSRSRAGHVAMITHDSSTDPLHGHAVSTSCAYLSFRGGIPPPGPPRRGFIVSARLLLLLRVVSFAAA